MLGFLTVWSSRTTSSKGVQEEEGLQVVVPVAAGTESNGQEEPDARKDAAANAPSGGKANDTEVESPASPPEAPQAQDTPKPTDATPTRPHAQQKRFSFRPVVFFKGHHQASHKRMVTDEQEDREREKAVDAAKRAALGNGARNVRKLQSDKQVKKSALALQQLIVGSTKSDNSPAGGAKSKPVTRIELKKIKSQLMNPKTAGKVIAILRDLPMPTGPTVFDDSPSKPERVNTNGPIHAVCLELPDAEANEKHFSKLKSESSSVLDAIPSVAGATLESLIPLFNDLHIISLISTPDFGLGKTADEEGLLAGAVPTAEAVIRGAVQITPQLMALGYATGKAITPDHKGVYPPLDRMSVITYWWGLEVCVPPPSMKNLANGTSISHTVVNLLTALSLINGGVAEILPFIRYISQFMDFEWNAIKVQDKGRGVVCAATWIMPAAMIPRSWDFPDPPTPGKKGAKDMKKSGGEHDKAVHTSPIQVPSPDLNPGAVDNVTIPPVVLPALVVSPPKQGGILERK